MYSILQAFWPSFTLPISYCSATEVDVAGLSGMSLLEWLGEPSRECADALDQQVH